MFLFILCSVFIATVSHIPGGMEGHSSTASDRLSSLNSCPTASTSSSLCSSDSSATETEETSPDSGNGEHGEGKQRDVSGKRSSYKEPDSISDESGYHDICYSDDDCPVAEDDLDEDMLESQVTSL